MTSLSEWATRWGVPREALDELLMATYQPPVASGLSGEMAVQQQIRAEAPALGCLLWRNNSGSLVDERGVPVRFGLGNDSAKVNAVLKSSDLIGITPVTDPVSGITRGVFTAIEVKAPGYKGPRTQHDQAQARFITLVKSRGGIAGFASDVEHYRGLVVNNMRPVC